LPKGNLAAAEVMLETLAARRTELLGKLESVNNLGKRRLITGLELRRLQVGTQDEEERLVRIHEVFASIFPTLEKIRELVIGQTTLFNNLSDDNSEPHISQMRVYGSQMEQLVRKVKQAIEGTPYPFEHPRGQICLEVLLREEPNTQTDEVFNQFSLAEKCLNQLFPLYFRTLGRLAQLADAPIVCDTPD